MNTLKTGILALFGLAALACVGFDKEGSAQEECREEGDQQEGGCVQEEEEEGPVTAWVLGRVLRRRRWGRTWQKLVAGSW